VSKHVLVARLDSAGDMLMTGPAIRAVAAGASRVTLLCGPLGRAAADLLPGVDRIIEWRADWITAVPQSPNAEHVQTLLAALAGLCIDEAIVFTARHHSPLPLALLLKMVGVKRVAGISADRAGTLLDVRIRDTGEVHEVERAVLLAREAGYDLPSGDDGRLRVDLPPTASKPQTLPERYVVVHPCASVPAREWSAENNRRLVALLAGAGVPVVVTGSNADAEVTRFVAGEHGIDLGGRGTFVELAHVLQRADVVVVGNTGPAHLAAAVGTPVVSLYAPTVPNAYWRPWGVPVATFGDQGIACANCRAEICPVSGHPCVDDVAAERVAQAVLEICRESQQLQEVQ
jgi:ADP-heptose:LPS heptosyltransferase